MPTHKNKSQIDETANSFAGAVGEFDCAARVCPAEAAAFDEQPSARRRHESG